MEPLTVANFMSPFPHAVGPDHSMAAAHRLMQRHHIRHLPILENGQLVGVISQRDLYFFEALTDERAGQIKVSEAMQRDVLAVAPGATMADVARKMVKARAGCVVVLEGEKVVGIFTTIDALAALIDITEADAAKS